VTSRIAYACTRSPQRLTPTTKSKVPSGAPGDEDREPRDEDREEGSHGQRKQDHKVRDREQHLHQRQPAVQVTFDIGIVDLNRYVLLFDR